jgi:sulfur carrier protein ThiS
MKVKLTMIPQNKKQVKEFDGKFVGDILKKFGLDREVYVFKKNGKVVTESEPLESGDHVEVIKVVSGG